MEAPKQRAPVQAIERPPDNEPMQRLKVIVSPSLKQALEKQLQQMSLQQSSSGNYISLFIRLMFFPSETNPKQI